MLSAPEMNLGSQGWLTEDPIEGIVNHFVNKYLMINHRKALFNGK